MARECGAVPDQMCCCGVDRFGRLRRSLDSPRASLLGFSGGGRLGTGDYCRLAGALPLVGPDRTTVGRSGRGVSGFEACSFIGPPPWWSTSREHRWVIFRERRRGSRRMTHLCSREVDHQGGGPLLASTG